MSSYTIINTVYCLVQIALYINCTWFHFVFSQIKSRCIVFYNMSCLFIFSDFERMLMMFYTHTHTHMHPKKEKKDYTISLITLHNFGLSDWSRDTEHLVVPPWIMADVKTHSTFSPEGWREPITVLVNDFYTPWLCGRLSACQ